MTENSFKKYRTEDIIQFGKNILVGMGFPEKDALITSEILVEADLKGIYSHGIAGGSSLDDILEKVKQGGIKINPDIKTEQKYPTILHIKADGSLGHSVSVMAVEEVKRLAREYGTAKVYVSDSSHFGIAGAYSERISEDKDLVGRITCTTPSFVLPFGGISKRLGTNPIAWSIPYQNGIITIDMATSQKAISWILREIKLKKPEEIVDLRERGLSDFLIGPDGKVINILGPEHTYDFVRSKCSINPLGGENYGYKGSGLAFLIELDSILGGGNIGFIPPGSKDSTGRVAHTFEAYVIDSLYDKDSILALLNQDVLDLTSYGDKNMKLPGQIEQELAEERKKSGIPYKQEQMDKLRDIGGEIGIPFTIKAL